MTEIGSEERTTIIDAIIEDHRNLQQLFAQGKETTDPEEFERIVSKTIAELVRHAVAEEQHLYPAFREHLEDGDQLADQEIAEHSEAEVTMKEMEGCTAPIRSCGPSSSSWSTLSLTISRTRRTTHCPGSARPAPRRHWC